MSQDPDFSRLRVLVADDEPRVRALVVSCASRLGCTVIEASDGDEASRLADGAAFDLFVLDVMMPGMSGWEVCRQIKTQGKTSRGTTPRVLMLTGIGTSLNDMTSPLFSADEWIDKPFSLDALSDRLRKLARESLTEAQLEGPSLKKARPPDGESPPARASKKSAAKKKKKKKNAKKRAVAKPVRRAGQKARRAVKRATKKAPAPKKKRAAVRKKTTRRR